MIINKFWCGNSREREEKTIQKHTEESSLTITRCLAFEMLKSVAAILITRETRKRERERKRNEIEIKMHIILYCDCDIARNYVFHNLSNMSSNLCYCVVCVFFVCVCVRVSVGIWTTTTTTKLFSSLQPSKKIKYKILILGVFLLFFVQYYILYVFLILILYYFSLDYIFFPYSLSIQLKIEILNTKFILV